MSEPENVEDMNTRRNSLEVEKLYLEVAGLRSESRRAWLTTVSIIGAIIVSLTTAYQYLETAKNTGRALVLESRLRTTEILQDKLLWQIAARSDAKITRTEQVAAFYSGLTLANEFPNVRPSIRAALENLANAGDKDAKIVLGQLKP